MTDSEDWQPQQGYGQQYPQEQPWRAQQYDPAAHAQRIGAGPQQQGQPQAPWQQYPPQQPPHGYQQAQYPPPGPPWQGQPPVPPQQPPRRRGKSWPARHKVLSGVIAAAAIVIIAVAASSSNKPSNPTASSTTAASGTTAASSTAASSSAPPSAAVSSAPASSAPSTPAAPAGPPMTAAQQQAVDAAQGYLTEGQGFSKRGLLDQLTSSYGDGFSKSDAEFAINDLNPNWDQQAGDATQGYLSEGQGFSDQGLLQQLTSSEGGGFTEAQAEHAINSLHPDWDAQAVDAAKGYMQMGGFSHASLIQQLTSSYGAGFTEAQAEYAVSRVGL